MLAVSTHVDAPIHHYFSEIISQNLIYFILLSAAANYADLNANILASRNNGMVSTVLLTQLKRQTLNCTCFEMKTNQEMLLIDPIEMWFSFLSFSLFAFIWLLLCNWTVSNARSDVNDKYICCTGCWLFSDDNSEHAHAHFSHIQI